MAITVYTGVPGSGKSYELVSQIIVPAVLAGRNVKTNIDGLQPDLVHEFCAIKDPAARLGSVVMFDGQDATKPGFWPTQDVPDTETFIKGGDVVVFDEWRLYFPKRGKWPCDDTEKFLRWHRHLTGPDGLCCDVMIGTQIASDVHESCRALVERSFKLSKLKEVGAPTAYSWKVWSGHLQPKGEEYAKGVRQYRREFFALYKSYKGGNGTETSTDKRTSIWGQGKAWGVIVLLLALACGAAFGFWKAFGDERSQLAVKDPAAVGPSGSANPNAVHAAAAPAIVPSPWRIVGQIDGEAGRRVIVADDKGAVRMLPPADFTFDAGRPVSGLVDGKTAVAEDRMPSRSGTDLTGLF